MGIVSRQHSGLVYWQGIEYRIMQIARGGRLSQLHAFIVICGKSFTIVWPVRETPHYKKKEFTGKLLRLQANPQKFSTTNDLHYTVPCIHVSMHTYNYSHSHKHIHTCICMYICIHTCSHAHTQFQGFFQSCITNISDKNKGQNLVGHFLKIGHFCRLLIVIPLKMYSKFGQPKWILVGQLLKLVGKWPMASCYF